MTLAAAPAAAELALFPISSHTLPIADAIAKITLTASRKIFRIHNSKPRFTQSGSCFSLLSSDTHITKVSTFPSTGFSMGFSRYTDRPLVPSVLSMSSTEPISVNKTSFNPRPTFLLLRLHFQWGNEPVHPVRIP
jgi:hypothetical protein